MKDVMENRPSLSEPATEYGLDKGSSKPHYTELYDMFFRPFRDTEIRFLEMGLMNGGPAHSNEVGRDTVASPSVQMRRAYFTKAKIIGLDVSDFSAFGTKRFHFEQRYLEDVSALNRAADELGSLDNVVDDESYAAHHQQNAFLELFPLLSYGGLYH